MKKKAPKIKKKVKGYVEGGTTLDYQETDLNYINKPDRLGKGEAKFGDYLKDYGRIMADNTLSLYGMKDVVKDKYKTDIGGQVGDVMNKYVQPIASVVGPVALGIATGGASIGAQAGIKAAQAGAAVINKQASASDAKLPDETDEEYSARMSNQGIDITQGKKDGGTISAEKAKEIMRDGTIRGKKITEKQKAYFGFIIGESEKKADGGAVGDSLITNKKINPLDLVKVDSVTTPTSARPMTISTKNTPKGRNATVDANSYIALNKEQARNQAILRAEMIKTGKEVPPERIKQLAPEYYNNFNRQRVLQDIYGGQFHDANYNVIPEFAGTKESGSNIENTAYGPLHDSVVYTTKKTVNPATVVAEKKADGGVVEGKGTAKSDSIKAEVKQGSFIVPAENAHIAELIREKYLGKDNKEANLHQSKGVDVKLSDGEHMFTLEEKNYLMSKGVNLEALAPNAKENTNEHKDGTTKEGIAFNPLSDVNTDTNSEISVEDLAKYKTPYVDANGSVTESGKYMLNQNNTKTKTNTTTTDLSPKNNKLEDAIALGQIGVGAYALLSDGKRPIDKLDTDYLGIIGDAKKAATYGFNPAELAQYESKIESNRRAMTDASVSSAGGNFATSMANVRAAGNISAKNLLDLSSANENLQLQKQQYRDALIKGKVEQSRRLFEDKLNAFNTNQQAGAELLGAGITSLQNAEKNKRTEALMKDLNKTGNVNIYTQ